MDHNTPTLPRVLSRAVALDLGVGREAVRYRVRTGIWARLAPGIYLTAPPALAADRCLAAALHGGSGAMVSGPAALLHYGVLRREPARELVLVRIGCGARSGGRIQVRPTPILPPAAFSELRLAPAARAVSDYAHQLTRQADVTALVTSAVQRRLCTIDDMVAELARGAQRGSKLLRIALEDAGHGAHSLPEAEAGTLLRRAGIQGFVHNARIQVDDGVLYGDFVWAGLRAVLEIDSLEHHFQPADQDATLARDHRLQMAGWTVLHVKPSQVRDAGRFVDLVRRWLDAVAGRLDRDQASGW